MLQKLYKFFEVSTPLGLFLAIVYRLIGFRPIHDKLDQYLSLLRFYILYYLYASYCLSIAYRYFIEQ
ncbi:hypothetical protein CPIN17261_0805 [Campylobacter pinnipediorum subsp. pinnipediorum]|uniref:hypothetical protein n=1 Tax=Campylobacter pinnipediorum TaxID=1965231 RepID=UPI00084D6D3F|nr:hypothetical protein [Campylobacter pinnipediorum]AQW81198.1 hypothetical protein CPIN17260_0898 [Campylobacter pinnipediorum subsp. pinnipediorum]AQW82816.1 hypothetical protein CPIN17261_0805 [Campylobacter pinnipediorum subsp. pinnipediorum]AQW84503.1 hypothetical protein CPIN17262_0819 [Campylobacter pinnipediorum subsp. pinnipediorum]